MSELTQLLKVGLEKIKTEVPALIQLINFFNEVNGDFQKDLNLEFSITNGQVTRSSRGILSSPDCVEYEIQVKKSTTSPGKTTTIARLSCSNQNFPCIVNYGDNQVNISNIAEFKIVFQNMLKDIDVLQIISKVLNAG